MTYKVRQYPQFSACGLNCGLCPRYHTDGASKCPGCAAADFESVHPSCGVLSCCQRHALAYCYQCPDYPCKKYAGADTKDSFISHKNQFTDFEKIKKIGPAAYETELNEKVTILETLLKNYNDGRRKSFFCLAVNLLPLEDIRAAMAKLVANTTPDATEKEKAAAAVDIFQRAADEMGILLKLRR
jgi:hypothetical protein